MSSPSLHSSDVSGRGLSGSLWKGVPCDHAMFDPSYGAFVFDDFLAFDGLVTSNVGKYSSRAAYISYEDTGGSVLNLATEVGGVIRLTTDATDNDEVWLQMGGAASVFGKITGSSAGKKMVMETRIRASTIASRNIFFGIAEEGFAVADAITDAGAMVTTKDFLGFRSLEGDAADLDAVYQAASQTTQVVKDDALTPIVAATWYKCGFIFDPNYPNPNQILRYFIDGVLIGGTLSLQTITALAAATFPTGEEMGPVWGVKNGATTATALDVDWVAIYQAP